MMNIVLSGVFLVAFMALGLAVGTTDLENITLDDMDMAATAALVPIGVLVYFLFIIMTPRHDARVDYAALWPSISPKLPRS